MISVNQEPQQSFRLFKELWYKGINWKRTSDKRQQSIRRGRSKTSSRVLFQSSLNLDQGSTGRCVVLFSYAWIPAWSQIEGGGVWGNQCNSCAKTCGQIAALQCGTLSGILLSLFLFLSLSPVASFCGHFMGWTRPQGTTHLLLLLPSPERPLNPALRVVLRQCCPLRRRAGIRF